MRYPRKKAGEKHRRYGTKRRPFHLEVLEHRRMLATFMVTNLMDSGPGSLRDAIAQANSDTLLDTIEFDSSLAGGTIALTQELEITESATINGLGASQLTIDAEGNSRVLRVDDDSGGRLLDVELHGLTITGGTAYGGAGISSRENLTITGSVITGNTVVDDFAVGAGIFHGFGQLAISGSTISNNVTHGAHGKGGGLYFLTNSVTLTDTVVTGNATSGSYASGAGIFAAAVLEMVLTRTTISDNSTSAGAARGGGIGQSGGTTTIVDSNIESNTAFSSGGGISVESNGTLSVVGSVINANTSAFGGGGIFATSPEFSGSISISRSEISGNSASLVGGVIGNYADLTIHNSTISNNVGNNLAGAIFSLNRLSLIDSTIANNVVTYGAGGIYNRGSQVGPGTVITNSTISGNTSGNQLGGIVNLAGSIQLSNSTVTKNIGNGLTNADYGQAPRTEVLSSIVSGNSVLDVSDLSTSEPTFVSNGHNLIGGGDLDGFTSNDQLYVYDPRLAPLADNGGPTLTHAPLPDSLAINQGVNDLNVEFDQRGTPFVRVADGFPDVGAVELQDVTIDGDFDDDGDYGCVDIDALVAEIAAATNGLAFDLTGDGQVDLLDRDAWLAEAGGINLGPGKVYLLGDADLSGFVDFIDLNAWSANRFTATAAWCSGDWNASGFVDFIDLNLWSENRFQSSASLVPGPTRIVLPVSPSDPLEINAIQPIHGYEDTVVAASGVPARTAPLAAHRVDSVFANSRRGDQCPGDRHRETFANIDGVLPINSYVL